MPAQYRLPHSFLSARSALALAAVLAAACAGSGSEPPIPSDSPLAGAPAWVLGDCHAHWSDGGARICGVGAVTGTRNVSLARTAAIGRARVAIGRILEAKIVAMLDDYAQTPAGVEIAARPDRAQYVGDIAKQISELSLTSTTLDDSWVGQDGTLHTLVSLDVVRFEGALDRITSLSESIRGAVKERARASFAVHEAVGS